MALKRYYVGSLGPYLYDDEEAFSDATFPAVTTRKGLTMEGAVYATEGLSVDLITGNKVTTGLLEILNSTNNADLPTAAGWLFVLSGALYYKSPVATTLLGAYKAKHDFTGGTTSLAVTALDLVTTAASGTTPYTITALTGGIAGQVVRIIFLDIYATVQNGAALKLRGGINYVPLANEVLTLVCDGSYWYETARTAA